MEEDTNVECKTWQVYCFEKRNALRFDLKREGFGPRGRGKKVTPCRGTKDREGMGKKQRKVWFEDVPPVEFMYLVFTHMPGESYHRQLRSFLLYLCYIFQVLINSFVC